MRHARSSRTAHGRAGNILVMFAVGLFGMLALAALIVDVGLVMLTRRQMQTAVNTAALEGLRFQDDSAFSDAAVRDGKRRERASALVAAVFDDNLDPGDGDEMDFGAGPQINFDDEPTDIPLPETNFRASRLIKRGNLGVYKPRHSNGTPDASDDLPGVEMNLGNQVHGDLVTGYWCFDTDLPSRDSHAEKNDYSREDFTLNENLVVTALSQTVDAADATIHVNSTVGFPVETSPFRPFLIRIDGEIMSVTDVAPPLNPTTWTVTRRNPSPQHSVGTQVSLVLPAAFLARMRRTDEDFSSEVGVASAGPPVPFLFGRGTAIRDENGGTELFGRRERGTVVRATAIARASVALTVGSPQFLLGRNIVGAAPIAIEFDDWHMKIVEGTSYVLNTTTGILTAGMVDVATVEFLTTNESRVVGQAINNHIGSWPAADLIRADSASIYYVPIITPITSTTGNVTERLVIGFGRVQLTRSGTSSSLELSRLRQQVGTENCMSVATTKWQEELRQYLSANNSTYAALSSNDQISALGELVGGAYSRATSLADVDDALLAPALMRAIP